MSEQQVANFQSRIAAIKNRYEPRIKALQEKAEKIGKDYETPSDIGVIINADIKVDWKDIEISFDLPTVTVKDQNISLDLPEVSSSTQRIVFDVPDVRMVDRKIGQYPEVHGFTIKWKDIIVTVPEPYMRRVDISFDLPSITMKRKDFVLGIPQFHMERQNWIISIPQFTVINVQAQAKELQEQGDNLKAEGKQIGSEMNAEIEIEVAKYTAELLASNFNTKTDVTNTYNQALGTVKSAIDNLSKQGCDPIKVPTSSGDVNLRKIYEDIDSSKSRTLIEIDRSMGTAK